MSSNVIDFGDNVSKTKREYSKGGCRECKRRKIKCDEGKPGCWQCVRLKKDCAYPYAGEKVARVSRKFLLYKGSNKDENEPESETSPSDPESRSSDLADGPGNVVKTGKKRKLPEISRGSVNNQPMSAYAAGEASHGNQNKQGALMNTTQGILKHSNRSNLTSTLIQTNQNLLSGNPKNNSKGSIRHVNDNPGHKNGNLGHANGSISQPNALANQPNTLSSQPNSNTSIHNAGLSHPDSNGNSTTNNMSAAFTFKRPNGYDVLTQIQSSQMNQLNQMLNQTLPSHVSTVPTDRFGVLPSGLSPGIPGIPNLSPSYMSPGIPSISSSYISPRFNHSSIESLLNNDNDHGIPDDQLFQLFNMDDLNLLASDLNNIVSNIMHELNFKFAAADEDDRLSAAAHGSSTQSTPYGAAPSPQPDTDKIPRNIPFEYIKVTKTHEKLYLEEFYNDFAGIILPFSSYDPATCCYFNPARDIILKCALTEAFLLAAVLAHGAKASFKKNSLKEDEEAYCKYLSKCLTLLGPALNNQNNLTSNIEAVLLTVLLLTAANAANPKQDWRAHLKGAKDLLLKISSRKMKSSKILIFCKFWFVLFEVLAGVSSRMGGTLKTEEEIENLITPGDEYEVQVLTDLGILVDSGFSILGGYHNDSVVHLKDLILILHRVRHNKDYQPKNPFEYLRLLSEFYKLTEIVFINSKCVLSEADFPDGKVPHGLLLDTLLINDEKVIISWMDTSHQAYVLASLITLLTVCFKETYELPQVQMLTNRVTSLVSFLSKTTEAPRQTIKCLMMMIQWPMLIAGMQCTREDGKYVLMKFFRISAQIGSGSAGFALRRVTNIWNYRERGLKVDYGFGDDTNDILSY